MAVMGAPVLFIICERSMLLDCVHLNKSEDADCWSYLSLDTILDSLHQATLYITSC